MPCPESGCNFICMGISEKSMLCGLGSHRTKMHGYRSELVDGKPRAKLKEGTLYYALYHAKKTNMRTALEIWANSPKKKNYT